MEEGTWRWWCFVACYVDAEVVERTGRSMARASRAQFRPQHDITSIWQETTCCSNKCYHNRTHRPRLGLAPQADGDWRTLNLLSRRHSSLFSSSVGVFRFVLEVLMPYTCTFYRHTNHQNSLQANSTSASMPRLQLAHTGSYNWPRLIVVNRTDAIKIPKLETLVMQCVYLTTLVNRGHSHS